MIRPFRVFAGLQIMDLRDPRYENDDPAPTLFDDLRGQRIADGLRQGVPFGQIDLAIPGVFMTPVARPLSEPLPSGELSLHLGRVGEALFDAQVTRFGGVSNKSAADDQPYDRIVTWEREKYTVQVKYATANPTTGRARFRLGSRGGYRSRRDLPYRGRADFFALITTWKGADLFWIIPAARLTDRVTLTINLGCGSRRRQGFDPSSYLGAWHLLAGEASHVWDVEQDSRPTLGT